MAAWPRVLRIAALGLSASVLAFLLGRGAERVWLGRDDAEARRRVSEDVRTAFDSISRELQQTSQRFTDPDALTAADAGDVQAARKLFDAARAAIAAAGTADELAVTAYSADAQPIAWAGRPSDPPASRLAGGEAWFFTETALGLRLVHVSPVLTTPDQRRIGTIATERALGSLAAPPAQLSGSSSPVVSSTSPTYQFDTRRAPVTFDFTEAASPPADESAFEILAPDRTHLLTARVAPEDLARTRARWRRATASLALMCCALTMLLTAGPLLDWRNRAASARDHAQAASLIALLIVLGRVLMRFASPADWLDAPVFSGAAYASPLLGALLASPFDYLLTAVSAGALVALAFFSLESWRLSWRHHRRDVRGTGAMLLYIASQIAAGLCVATVLLLHQRLLRDTIANTAIDLLHFSIHPWSTARLSLQVGLIVWHATAIAAAVAVLRAAAVPWRVSRHDWRLVVITIAAWVAPLALWQLANQVASTQRMPELIVLGTVVALGTVATLLKARYHHGSQAFRLTMLTMSVVVPAIAFYPSVFRFAWQAKAQLVETRYAPQALNQRQAIQLLLQQSLDQIDQLAGLAELAGAPGDGATSTDRAFQIWRSTAMAAYPLTSSVELYGPDGRLVSRFAFNLPDDLTAAPRSEERTCDWQIYEEVAPFFAEERKVLHAGRAICAPGQAGRILGSIVVLGMLDYANLPFISSQSPYVELLRPTDPLRNEGLTGGDVEYVVYGWSRTPVYASSDIAWRLDDALFTRITETRAPIWTRLQRGGERFDVYLMNDRGGIYALGFPTVSIVEHLVNLSEVTVLAAATYILLLALNAAFGILSRRGTSAPALLREVRASFYRKLFLAFVLTAVVPVVALAIVTRYYVAGQMDASIAQEAVRTASAARRVVEDLAAPRAVQQRVGIDDNLMVWVSRLIDQDVNIFSGPRLLATSERNLFASGLLPTRTPADVYRALELENEASTVARERLGTFEYLVAAAPISARQIDATLTVPLTSRQQEIESEIDTLDRRVLLGVLLFILAGAGIGYSMAERIADPVNRLTRATRRLARGDLDTRIAATSSDELRRLVEDFNGMAQELQRQRTQLERTHRLEAWAEMARQVAHEIKNPLTPIQLNAEHLRRVHADRGEPLGPVLQDCVGTILTQVKLLRQIASEFSSFASSPTARPARVEVPELLQGVIEPYRAGLGDRIRFDIDVPSTLPDVTVDRTLIQRSLTNIVENALHAMPGSGTLTIHARAEDHAVRIQVSDTGVGMDDESLARAFEPYFSTKTTGTGLGLPIAKRNVELNGGSISVRSERNQGTTVEVTLPAT